MKSPALAGIAGKALSGWPVGPVHVLSMLTLKQSNNERITSYHSPLQRNTAR